MNSGAYGKKIVYLLYDGIENSVFCSQVLTPILKLLGERADVQVLLISFESKRLPAAVIQKIIPAHDRLHLVLCKKFPYFSRLSLRLACFSINSLLVRGMRGSSFSHVIARGPFAGWIAMRVFAKVKEVIYGAHRPGLTIQARGLVAQEFAYAMSHSKKTWASLPKRMVSGLLYRSYKRLEHEVYSFGFGKYCVPHDTRDTRAVAVDTIEAVSPALRQYLINNFAADPTRISVAHYDIPPVLLPEQISAWRSDVRQELGIPADTYVYCYTGSAHPWQGVDEMITYFMSKDRAFFLIFSREKEFFEKKLAEHGIDRSRYAVKTIDPGATYRYLSAADAGLLFRKKDSVNWVARPTKMLEYQAVGLKVIHNNTVGWLCSVD